MTMNGSSAPYVTADEVEGIPAVNSAGSCVVSVSSNGGNDAGSVGSTNTKTRFSFYNAQEVVQMEEQNQTSSSAGSPTATSRGGASRREGEETAKSTPVKSSHRSPNHHGARARSDSNHGTPKSSASAADQRFNFYVAEEFSTSSKSKTEERRSPHTLLDSEADKNDNKRTPAVATTSNGSEATPKLTLHIKATSPAPVQSSTPQRNNTLSSSAQKKKQRAVQAAAARARSHKPADIPTPQATNNSSKSKTKPTPSKAPAEQVKKGSGDMDSVEILRSLKDTEQMRFNLMKECHPPPKISHNISSGYSDAANAETQEDFQDAAEALSLDSQPDSQIPAPPVAAAAPTTTAPQQKGQPLEYQEYNLPRATNAAPLNAAAPTGALAGASAAAGGNPYEDAIREALDLLRRHRPPSPSRQAPTTATANPGQDASVSNQARTQQRQQLAIDMNVVHGGNQKMTTPRDADRVLLSRYESPAHAQEDMEARRKERQERMARYTSRLAEIKGGEDVYNSDLHRPASTIDEGDDESRLSADPLTALDELVASASFASQKRTASVSPSAAFRGGPGNATDIPATATCPSGDLVSLETASSLSASNYNPPPGNSQKEVHRSVERVLLAILERAHSNGRSTQGPINASGSTGSPQFVPEPTSDPAWQQMEEKKSASEDRSGGVMTTPKHQQLPQQPQLSVEDDPLLRAVGELLSTSAGGSMESDGSHVRPSDYTEQSSVTSVAKRSVVEELLAEAESFQDLSNLPPAKKAAGGSSSVSQSVIEKPTKRSEDLLNCSTGVEAVHADADVAAVVVDKELDDLVLKTLGKSTSEGESNPEMSTDAEDDTGDYEEETGTQSGSYDDDDEEDEDEEDDDIHGSYGPSQDSEDLDEALEGVLGPLSGGTTGVVLESNFAPSSPDRSNGERSIFDSLSNAMSSLVASAISGDDKQSIRSNSKASSRRDKYSTGMDSDETGYDKGEQSSGASEDIDEEASELMRTLCAHLLPFGVEQSSRFLDEVPHWDDNNPNEAGYRIIRLTNQQLERVERAFEAMVLGLKKNSEQNLLAGQPESINADATFERDLAVAEKALDREEENRTVAIMKSLKLHPDTVNDYEKGPSSGLSCASQSDATSIDIDASVTSEHPDICHPHFPGVHSAGKGEMGDLEYFNLPVIFKSHVTGFEPTKDLFLEPGNVVAGQYLVESELGSAAFSTAYRCVDLNSEGDDTEDGHKEVCLKVIKNTKDFFDQSLDEIKILELLRQTGKCQKNNIIEMRTFFYHREHLIIVTELLRQNLFEFGKFILDHDEEPYFTLPRLGYITRQCLIALRFVHGLGLVHSDVKPENILLGSYSRAQVKIIDFGSSCYLTDRQSSYIQSRSYRAPEVVLGLPYDGKIDVWSLGCVVAEMLTGEVTFQNDSIVSMLSRIEAICGPFPRHMIAQGRQSCRFFTKCGLLYEKVSGEDGQKTPDASGDEDESMEGRGRAVFDIFQPKVTTFSSRLGFAPDLQTRYASGASLSPKEEKEALFVDFVSKLLTIDPDSRLSASEALRHPWMLYAATLTEEDIKYPSQ